MQWVNMTVKRIIPNIWPCHTNKTRKQEKKVLSDKTLLSLQQQKFQQLSKISLISVVLLWGEIRILEY